MSHNNGFALETDFAQQEYGHIYTFVYSRKNGMKIYRDGNMIAEDQSDPAKESLINNLNAKIGAPNNQKMSILWERIYNYQIKI